MLDGDLTYDEFKAMVDAWGADYNVNKNEDQVTIYQNCNNGNE